MQQLVCNMRRRLMASAVFTALVLLVGLTGCAGQKATITPTVVVEPEALGHGVDVSVAVRDTRSEAVIGQCNPDSVLSGKLTVACDPAPAIRKAVVRGLHEKGFTPVPPRDAVARSVTVKLVELTYRPSLYGAVLNAKAEAVLSVTADNNGQTMTRRYKADTVWKLSGTDVEPEFDRLLSQVVSKAISHMASDYDLIHFLKKTVLRTRDLT